MTEPTKTILDVIQRIDDLDDKAAAEEYTDLGELWDLVYLVRSNLNQTLPINLRTYQNA